ncbi:MAG: CHAT domain-containing protein [Bacteroidetes bacterium]|nr:MAG: CHAT domain-containing protein [Bacteroidota bacterium]
MGASLLKRSEEECRLKETCRLYLYALVLKAEIVLSLGKADEALSLLREAATYLPAQSQVDMDELYLRLVELKAHTQNNDFSRLAAQCDYLLAALDKNSAIDPGSVTQVYDGIARAYLARGLRHNSEEDIQRADSYVQEGMRYWEQLINTASNQDDVRYSLQEYYGIFEVAFNVLYELHQRQPQDTTVLARALRYFESTKNLELRSSLKRTKVARQLGVPTHLLQRQQKWNQQIFILRSTLDHHSSLSVTERMALAEELNALQTKLHQLEEALLRDYPAYVKRIHRGEEYSLSTLQAQLGKEQQSIVYFLAAEESLFTIAISPTGQVFCRSRISSDSLADLVGEIRALVDAHPYEPAPKTIAQLAQRNYQLYNILLAAVDSILTERLVIIPDGPMEILPFSLLLTKAPAPGQPPATWPYLIREHSISYAYGLELWLQQERTAKDAAAVKSQILAFAPSFNASDLGRDSLRKVGVLAYNQDEVTSIANRFPAQVFTADEAHINHFRTYASDYSILHLATHAKANTEVGEYSYLAFAPTDKGDYRLEVGELYAMDIPAELVVLSACETGIGEWQRGEGVIGLERAFAFAGAESLITTYWRVSDRASADFMSGFYAFLAKGLSKDQALRQAQLCFMEEHDKWLAHPFYWSAYVQKGSTAVLPLRQRSAWSLWVGAAVVLLLMASWFYQRTQVFLHAS